MVGVLRRSYLWLISAVVMAGFCQTKVFLAAAVVPDAWNRGTGFAAPVYGPAAFLYVIYFSAAVLALTFMYVRDVRQTTGGEHAELSFILIGEVLALGLVLLSFGLGFVLERSRVVWFAPFRIVLFSLVIAYGIATRKIMEVGVFLRMAMAYVVLTAYIVALYAGVWWLVETVFQPALGGKANSVAHVCAAIVVAFAMAPARGVSQRLADRLFVGTRRLDFRATMRKAADILKSVTTVRDLLDRFALTTAEAMGTERVLIFLLDRHGYLQRYPEDESGRAPRIETVDPVTQYLMTHPEPLVFEELHRIRSSSELRLVIDRMKKLRAAAILGIFSRDGLAGIMLLGRAPCSACSGPTAPARPPPCASSPRCSSPTRGTRPRRRPRRRAAGAAAARAHRPRRPVRRRRREPHRPREPRAGRAASTTSARRASRRRAARAARAFELDRRGRPRRPRPTPAACAAGSTSPPRSCPPAGAVPRRAHHRPRPAQPHRAVGARSRTCRRRHDRAAHHAVPRGGRPARRPHRRDRPRPRDRRGHRRRAQGPARRRAARGHARATTTEAERAIDGARADRRRGDPPTADGAHVHARRSRGARGSIAEAVRRLDAAEHRHRATSRMRRPTLDDVFLDAHRHAHAEDGNGAAERRTVTAEHARAVRVAYGHVVATPLVLARAQPPAHPARSPSLLFAHDPAVIFVLMFRYVFGGAISDARATTTSTS